MTPTTTLLGDGLIGRSGLWFRFHLNLPMLLTPEMNKKWTDTAKEGLLSCWNVQ